MSLLRVRIPSRFQHSERPAHPPLPDGAGLAIAAEETRIEAGRLYFWLLISYALPVDYARSFLRTEDSMVAVLRDRAGGEGIAFTLADEFANGLEDRETNFIDKRGKVPFKIVQGARMSIPMEVEFELVPDHPGLFVHVALQGMLSNLLAIPLGAT